MARKSKYQAETYSEDTGGSRWRAALYIRLSREDGDKEESDSIANQRVLLQEFADNDPELDVYGVYVDDGWSGANFDRPDFLRMMEDIKSRSVNCVVVKDLSRFGRNYIDAGNYIEKVFPFMDVRFISVNDALDSFRHPQSMNNLVVPFKNIINDEYCRDISNKVRSSLDLKRRQGKFIGSFAAYGYLKDPDDRNRLIIDEYAAEVVRDIYKWFISGMGVITIAKRLNERGILNPTAYKQSLGLNYRHPAGRKNDGLWPDSSVRRILTNKLYTGTLVQGVNKTKSYKVQVSVRQPREQWFEVENTHEAIIDPDAFQKVQILLTRDTRTSSREKNLYLFSGFLRCADCGRAMNRKLIRQPYGDYAYYICGTFKKMGANACAKHTIRADKLEKAVFVTIQKQIELAVSMDEIIAEINARGGGKKDTERLIKTLSARETEKQKTERLKLALYPDWKNGDLTKEEYQALKARFDEELERHNAVIENLKKEIQAYQDGVDGTNAFLSSFTKHGKLKTLTRELLAALVDCVYVHNGGAITIQFNFADEFKRALEYVEGSKDVEGA